MTDNFINKSTLFEMLKKHFPETIKENVVDMNAIKRLLGLENSSDSQGYELTFTGKGIANALYSSILDKELKLEISQSKNIQETKNSIIRGDNLDALKILKQAYSNKIKMIYIDPPYNTKKDEFIYNDNFRKDFNNILRKIGLIETDDNGGEKESESLKFFKNITGSRSHSGWLCFMLPRLKLARDLLKDDGVIFISIDDNEGANLKILCDEIFGEENFVANSFVLDNLKGKSNDNLISNVGHKILIYAKNINILIENSGFNQIQNIFGNIIDKKFNNLDENGLYNAVTFKKTGQGRLRTDRPFMYYPILIKNDNVYSILDEEYEKIYSEETKEFNDSFIEELKNKYQSNGYIFVLPISDNGDKLRWSSSFKSGFKICSKEMNL